MAVAGFMGGLAGMGGPAAVMWVMAHNWTTQRSRVMLWSLFMGLMPLQFVFLTLQFGRDVVDASFAGLLLAPATVLGLLPGLWIGRHMRKEMLRRLGEVILLIVALWAIVQPGFQEPEPPEADGADDGAAASVIEWLDAGEESAHCFVVESVGGLPAFRVRL